MSGSVQKLAVFDEKQQEQILGACSATEYVPVWLMMRLGCHSHDLVHREKFEYDGQWLRWKRCKTGRPRQFPIPLEVAPKLVEWLTRGRRLTRDGYCKMVHRIGARVGMSDLSPMSLRHTFGINAMRRFKGRGDAIQLVASMMGCSERILVRNYLDFEQWLALDEGIVPTTVATPPTTPTVEPMGPETRNTEMEARHEEALSVLSKWNKKHAA